MSQWLATIHGGEGKGLSMGVGRVRVRRLNKTHGVANGANLRVGSQLAGLVLSLFQFDYSMEIGRRSFGSNGVRRRRRRRSESSINDACTEWKVKRGLYNRG